MLSEHSAVCGTAYGLFLWAVKDKEQIKMLISVQITLSICKYKIKDTKKLQNKWKMGDFL